MPEWVRVKRIVQEALELSESSRGRFLDDACGGDAELRADVESLLATESDSFAVPMPSAALTPGAELGAYVVAEPVGAGGMGEVYRARDTKLGRDVALKVLPSAFARDAERVARFKREARLLASLSHPNIAGIHGLETADGIDFLVLELVPGETLAEHLAAGPLTYEDAVEIAIQIADALDAAHEKGVVHRDLKPANIKITLADEVKVLDFGLAKAQEPPPGQSLSDSPTLTAAGTREGIILGTASYMSPEQVRGKSVDKRSDIFSFGVVLYEMLTGNKAFPGGDVSEILAAVMRDDPDWSSLPASTPAGMRKLLRSCLHKDRKERRRDIGDVRGDLRDLLSDEPATVALEPTARAHVAVPWVLFGIMAALALWFLERGDPKVAPRVVRTSINVLPTTYLGSYLDVSPDGTRVVYVAGDIGASRLYSRHLGEEDSVPIVGTENGIEEPFFSPDGEWIAFVDRSFGWRKVRLDGVGSVALFPADAMPQGLTRGGAWTSDGRILFGTIREGVITMSEEGGAWEPLTAPDPEGRPQSHVRPHLLPGGDAVLFASNEGGAVNDYRISVERLSTGERRRLVRGNNPYYAPTGHLIFARERTLYAAPFDLERLAVEGEGVPVQTGVREAGNQHIFAVSDTGTLVYEPSRPRDRRVLRVDLDGRVEPLAIPAGPYDHVRFSPSGDALAVSAEGGRMHLFELETERFSVLFDSFEDADGTTWTPGHPVWSPDGTRFAVAATAPGSGLREEIFLVPVDGRGRVDHLVSKPARQRPSSWSPDGTLLLYSEMEVETYANMWELPLEPIGEPRPMVEPPTDGALVYQYQLPMLSPDGRWLAYQARFASAVREVYVKPYGDAGVGRQVSFDGGIAPVWSPDGDQLYYLSGDEIMAVAIRTEPTFRAGRPRVVFDGGLHELDGTRTFDLAPDGRSFVIITKAEVPAVTQLHIVQNWFEELKRLVPVD